MTRPLAAVMCVGSLIINAACQPRPPSSQVAPIDVAAQTREQQFRWKERCAAAAQQFDRVLTPMYAESRSGSARRDQTETSVSEVFYSPVRNSCICEVSAVSSPPNIGLENQISLYDCLTREELESALLQFNRESYQHTVDAWHRTKDALKQPASIEPVNATAPAPQAPAITTDPTKR